ncbi:MAG TPA: DUF4168 domain-containing protein [Croceibacterium sp.]|nr:DUF4168 domain-containing protein [Croceibacterium sp.]
MRKLAYPLLGLAFIASTAYAQDAGNSDALPGGNEAVPTAPADAAPPPSDPLASDAGTTTSFTDQQVDQFAEATVKVQAIDADTSIAADQKQSHMAAAVTEAGLDPATYNQIGQAVAVDAELRNRVQVAMARHAGANPAG